MRVRTMICILSFAASSCGETKGDDEDNILTAAGSWRCTGDNDYSGSATCFEGFVLERGQWELVNGSSSTYFWGDARVTTSSVARARWSFNVPSTGSYSFLVHIPGQRAVASAQYTFRCYGITSNTTSESSRPETVVQAGFGPGGRGEWVPVPFNVRASAGDVCDLTLERGGAGSLAADGARLRRN